MLAAVSVSDPSLGEVESAKEAGRRSNLGASVRTLPALVVGTSPLGSVVPSPFGPSRKELAFLDAALDAGLSAFDLAASYQAGGTERLFGHWLRSRSVRERVFLIGKGGHPLPLVAPHRLGRAALTADLEASLRRLGTDRFDLYLLHRDDGKTPLEEIAETLASFRRSGKILDFGVSNWTASRLATLLEVCRRAGLPEPRATSPHFSLFEWTRPPYPGSVSMSSDAAALELCRRERLLVLPWAPLASGFVNSDGTKGVFASPENRARLLRLRRLAARRGTTPTALALAYVRSRGVDAHPIVFTTRPERLAENLRNAENLLTSEECAWLVDGSPELFEDSHGSL